MKARSKSDPQATPAECTADGSWNHGNQSSSRVDSNPDPGRTLELVEIQNQILQHDLAEFIPVKLDKEEKVEYDARVKSHNKKLDDLKLHQGKVYMLIMGQCTQQLQDKLKQNVSWSNVDTTPKNPNDLMNLI